MTYRHGKTFRAHSQFLRAAAQHDNASPPEDPVWDEYDAMANVADKLHVSRDTMEILGDLADAADWLAWIRDRCDLPKDAQQKVDWLAEHAKLLRDLRADELDALNGGGE
jgi:hypothetical protein